MPDSWDGEDGTTHSVGDGCDPPHTLPDQLEVLFAELGISWSLRCGDGPEYISDDEIRAQEQEIIAAARVDAEARVEAYNVAVVDTLEWLDGHAAPDVTAATIEAKLYVVQGITATLTDPPVGVS